MTVLDSLSARDAGLAALRRSCRAAIVVPSLFALGTEVLGNSPVAMFAAFGSIALLLFVDFGGPLPERLAAQAWLVVAGAALVCLGTLASDSVWLPALAMAVVAFGVLFSGVVSSVIAASATPLLAVFTLAVMVPGPAASLLDRLAGYSMAGAASLIAIVLLWPAPVREPLRHAMVRSCALLADCLRAEVECARGDSTGDNRVALEKLLAESSTAVAALRTSFFGTPYRPTGLTTATRMLVRLVDEVVWLEEILNRNPLNGSTPTPEAVVGDAMWAAADLLGKGAARLESLGGDVADLEPARQRLQNASAAMEQALPHTPPVKNPPGPRQSALPGFIGSPEPSFRAQEMSSLILSICENIESVVAARDRRWWQRALGRRPANISSALSLAQVRAGAHIEPHSVWMHNSVRGAAALGLAVLMAGLTGVQNSFWMVSGTMAVLRSNALLTGQNALRALTGTLAGIIVGSGLIFLLGSNHTMFWVLLPPAILVTGIAPAAISFAAGQAGFTVALLILFNIIAPEGWTIGLVRFEDVALGCAVSVGVGLLFWPRGAVSALGQALAEAFEESAGYLRRSIEYGLARGDELTPFAPAPENEQRDAAAAARRLDDAFRGFLAERGTKKIALADITALMTAVTVLRLTADAVVELWDQDDLAQAVDHRAARAEILRGGLLVCSWYREAARALSGYGEVPPMTPRDKSANEQMGEVGRRELVEDQVWSTSTAIRLIWTADHIAVARQLQGSVAGPARRAAISQRRMKAWAVRGVGRRRPPHTPHV
ncbi:FUSC family protein [Streptomyces sp. NBC_00059]|uniref:FUSC family protein n=1 Tax=Streptomyces sp. NBC_00059 TaxID=2975635 RepID=UPI0022539AF9|nr:FUSC family protein [Streptomyces sp. NBC_00059]MCX5414249.1 FUSC family protein [Streptomyces sp. NBC_00059]